MDLTESQHEIEQKAQKFALMEIAPFADQLENDLLLRDQIYRKMAQENFLLMNVPEKMGGNYSDTLSYALVIKALAAVDAGIATAMSVINMVAEVIYKYGNDEQRKKYIQNIKQGNQLPLAFALTEKESGSDAKSIHTSAVVDPNDKESFILNGSKQFITNADAAGFILVLAKTDANKGSKGITAFLLEKGMEGIKIVKKERKLGLLSANLIDFDLINCKIPRKNILGHEGQGFEIAMYALDSGRIGVSALALGIAEAAYHEAVKHAKERKQFGKSLADYQAISFKLADMFVKLNAGNALLHQACKEKDSGKNIALAASMAKLFCSEASNEIVNDALQIYGGYGYVKDYPMERFYRDVRVTTLYEGTSEIQRLIISRSILGEN